jgi:hypothetical protein
MPENNPAAPIELAEGYNPFADDAQPAQQIQPVEVAPTNTEAQVPVETQGETVSEPAVAPSFDPNQFVRERFGFESVEEAEEQFKRVKDFKEPEFNFENDISKTLFDAIKEGKTDEVYDILNQQKRLEKLTTADVDANLAVDIIKTNLANKYKELNSEEIDLLFYEQYYAPIKPEQGYDESDEDYSQKLKTWQSQVDYAEKKMIIDAKVYRTDLAKLKADIKLPDISREAERQVEYQEDFEMQQKARSIYETTLDSQFQTFNGFNVSVKDAEVEIPISFNVGDDEKLAIKNDLSDFDSDSYFGGRWFNDDGTPKVQQIMADKYLLENREKIFSKIANEAASQRLLAHLKKTGNININQPTPQGIPTPSPDAERDRLAAWAFSV